MNEIDVELNEIEQFARERYIPVMLDDTKELLFSVVKAAKPRRILEIGTAVGYSGIVMLLASPNAKLNTMEINESLAELARQNFAKAGMTERVNIFLGDARELVCQLIYGRSQGTIRGVFAIPCRPTPRRRHPRLRQRTVQRIGGARPRGQAPQAYHRGTKHARFP